MGYSPWGRKESDTTLLTHFHLYLQEKREHVICKGITMSSSKTGDSISKTKRKRMTLGENKSPVQELYT